jgi:hypothetical protein
VHCSTFSGPLLLLFIFPLLFLPWPPPAAPLCPESEQDLAKLHTKEETIAAIQEGDKEFRASFGLAVGGGQGLTQVSHLGDSFR